MNSHFQVICHILQIVWGQKLLILDGHSKYSSYVTGSFIRSFQSFGLFLLVLQISFDIIHIHFVVRFLDPETQQCGVMETIGELPVTRYYH